RLLGPAAQGTPGLAADLVELRRGDVIGIRDPALDQIQAVDRDAEDLAAGVLDGEGFELGVGHAYALEPQEPADSVVQVDHVVAGAELGETLQGDGAAEPPSAPEPPRAL